MFIYVFFVGEGKFRGCFCLRVEGCDIVVCTIAYQYGVSIIYNTNSVQPVLLSPIVMSRDPTGPS